MELEYTDFYIKRFKGFILFKLCMIYTLRTFLGQMKNEIYILGWWVWGYASKYMAYRKRNHLCIFGLLVWFGFSSQLRVSQPHADAIINDEWKTILPYPWQLHCIAFEHWRLFDVPHLLWHSTSVYNVHLRVPMILIPIANRFAVVISLPF